MSASVHQNHGHMNRRVTGQDSAHSALQSERASPLLKSIMTLSLTTIGKVAVLLRTNDSAVCGMELWLCYSNDAGES